MAAGESGGAGVSFFFNADQYDGIMICMKLITKDFHLVKEMF